MFISSLLISLTVLNPLNYGLLEAKTDVERYQVLYNVHTEAVKKKAKVSYIGIDTIRIQIPPKAKSIPLSGETDFAGVVLCVRNESNLCYLFKRTEKVDSILISARHIDNGKFSTYSKLKKGRYLLIIKDGNPWVMNRIGYKNGSTRKDILYIVNGKAKNRPIMPYDNAQSEAICTYRALGNPLLIQNLTLIRDSESSKITKCFCLENLDDIYISNITVKTTDNPYKLYGDGIFVINNCTNLNMENVRIDGTYSLKNKYGYGINMDNVWNCSFSKLYAHGEWGIFGNNNVNVAKLLDCDINRMDVHCYGRDIFCYRCNFKNYYNQYSSVYGTIYYDHCYFENFLPYLNEGSYNAYVPVKIYIKDCTWIVTKKYNYIIDMWYPYDKQKESERQVMRSELAIRHKPDIKIRNLYVIYREGENEYKIYR